jgi:hypothetical protein
MTADPTHSQPSRLAPLYGQFPRWEAWAGVGGILYARLRKSSPPIVVRDATAEGLADKMRQAEAELQR